MYGRGDGNNPCTCFCFDATCEEAKTIDPSYDFFNIQEEKDISKNSDILVASISDISGVGLVSITFNNEVDLEYL